LHRIPGLEVDDDLCQEDWGVVVFAQRGRRRFWIGLSSWDSEGMWLAHVHHRTWLQRFTRSGKAALDRLLVDVHAMLTSDPVISNVAWKDLGL